ncbi:hypothetical protein N0V93_008839 [Gnomoniopsis smithogilvyi]|uniref:Ketoreductase domain-containing protein n=1 Tax=Gnomoniopsis smithogilvyi TaxID=1191159 RepID=A0A9W9CV54_9PEZI|nr:hypothetical protein N0V93_008839 [Gnomoniopsis smithogilvyi]
MDFSSYRLAGVVIALAIPSLTFLIRNRDRRHLPSERVLILGASSGLGRSLALHYARRGARVCVVARRADKLKELESEGCLAKVADMTVVDDMIGVRTAIEAVWGGLDTVHVCAGVSALQPVMALTGRADGDGDSDASEQGVSRAVEIAGRAMKGNFEGPFVAAVTFIPMLTRTSSSPAILLVSSAAAIIPAPTRALYASSKAASLLLYQALAIEHRNIAFSFILPSTIEGNFRASAVDAGPVREADPNKTGLKTDYVAKRCIDAVDRKVRGNIVIPWYYNFGHIMYYFWPSRIERAAAKKYNFA